MNTASKSKKKTKLDKDSIERLYRLELKPMFRYFKKERPVFWLACIYLFFEYVRIQLMYPSIDILPWTFLSILMMIGLAITDKKVKWTKSGGHTLMFTLLAVVILSSIFSENPKHSFRFLWPPGSIYIWMIIFFTLVPILNSDKRFYFFIVIYLLFNLKMSQHGFFEWIGRGFAFDAHGVQGPPGWFHNSGELGIQLCVFLPIALYFIKAFYADWDWPRRLFFMLMPLTAVGAGIASSSRGALVGMAASALVVLWKSPYKFKGTLALVVIGMLVYKSIPDESMERFRSSGDDSTSQQRLIIWKIGIDEMNKNPIFGVGFENWEKYYRKRYPEFDHHTALVHNIFIQVGTEMGYVGLGVFILMIIYSFTANRQTRKFAEKMKNRFFINMAHGFDVSLAGMLVSSSFVTVFYYPYFWVHMIFVVALNRIAWAQFRQFRKENKEKLEREKAELEPAEPAPA